MKSDDLRKAIGGVDDDLVEAAGRPKKNNKKTVWPIVIPIAAAAAAVVIAAAVMISGGIRPTRPETDPGKVISGETGGAFAQWEKKLTLEEVIAQSNTAFRGRLISIDKVADGTEHKYKFEIVEDYYGNISDETVYCYFTDGLYETLNGYRIGDEFLMLTERRSMVFYPNDEYLPGCDYCFDLTTNECRLFEDAIELPQGSELTAYILSVHQNAADPPQEEYYAFTLKVRLDSVFRESTPEFAGTAYYATVLEVLDGDLSQATVDENGQILITLMKEESTVGKTYVVEVVKTKYSLVYAQEKPGTVKRCDP